MDTNLNAIFTGKSPKAYHLVCEHIYKIYGDYALEFIDSRLIKVIEFIMGELFKSEDSTSESERFFMIINNYYGKENQDKEHPEYLFYEERGLQCNLCRSVLDRTRSERSHVTPHILGKAIDFDIYRGVNSDPCQDGGSTKLSSDDIRSILELNKDRFPYPVRVDYSTHNYVYLDVMTKDGDPLYTGINIDAPTCSSASSEDTYEEGSVELIDSDYTYSYGGTTAIEFLDNVLQPSPPRPPSPPRVTPTTTTIPSNTHSTGTVDRYSGNAGSVSAGKYTLDIDKACRSTFEPHTVKDGNNRYKTSVTIVPAKNTKSYHSCASGVRQYLNAGGLPGSLGNGYGCGPALQRLGFKKVKTCTTVSDADSFIPKPGDVATMRAGNRPFEQRAGYYGHICMYNGSNWVSDFCQNSAYVYRSLSSTSCEVIYWRFG